MDAFPVWANPLYLPERFVNGHPRLALAGESSDCVCRFEYHGSLRSLFLNRPEIESGGLIEIIDNNPLVCANEVTIPGKYETLALIGLLPIVVSGALAEPPAIISSGELDIAALEGFLRVQGWNGGAIMQCEPADIGRVCAVTILAEVPAQMNQNKLQELFSERYERSYFVRNTKDWSVKSVEHRSHAVYRVGIEAGSSTNLAKIQCLADQDGKCGACQALHMLNIMCGFEETLGIPDDF